MTKASPKKSTQQHLTYPNVAIFHLPRNGTAGAAAKPQKAFSRMKLHAESTNVLVTLNCRPRLNLNSISTAVSITTESGKWPGGTLATDVGNS